MVYLAQVPDTGEHMEKKKTNDMAPKLFEWRFGAFTYCILQL